MRIGTGEEVVVSKADDILDNKESYNFLRGGKRARVKVAMKEHTRQSLEELKRKVKQQEEDLEEKVRKLRLSGNPDDWILANGTEQVRMGVHSALRIIEEVQDE